MYISFIHFLIKNPVITYGRALCVCILLMPLNPRLYVTVNIINQIQNIKLYNLK